MTGASGGPSPGEPPTRLARRLGTADAVIVGLGAMVGAGVFAAVGPAAAAAGSGLLLGLLLAAAVAYVNAVSSAALAARSPTSGGTYVYGRERLGPFWGFLAGWAFVVGKTASGAAMALTFGNAVAAGTATARVLAVAAVVSLTGVNLLGVQKTAALTRVILAVVFSALVVVVGAAATTAPQLSRLDPRGGGFGVGGVLQAAGLLFFAFAGYARVTTLGEEVRDPARAIPRAVRIALAITLATYTVVAVAALAAVGPAALAAQPAALVTVVDAGTWPWAGTVVRVGAAVASLGVLLSLLVGVSRTLFAMSAERDLPRWLDAVQPVRRVPHRAEGVVAVAVVLVVVAVDSPSAIGFSAFAVLFYYAVANASAWTLAPGWPRMRAGAGLVGCVTIALALPPASKLAGGALLGVGALLWWVRSVLRRTA